MSAQSVHTNDPVSGSGSAPEIAWLAALGPEAQGDVDESLLRENLALTPLERLEAANLAATQVEQLQRAMKAASHG